MGGRNREGRCLYDGFTYLVSWERISEGGCVLSFISEWMGKMALRWIGAHIV